VMFATTVKLMFLVAIANPCGLYDVLARMSGPDRGEVVFQATAVDNNKHDYAIQDGARRIVLCVERQLSECQPKTGART
jgi:hypothetical protein